MAYQNVGKPRFFINILEYLHSTGVNSSLNNIYRTSPINTITINSDNLSFSGSDYNAGFVITHGAFSNNNFIALLGHNFGGSKVKFLRVDSSGGAGGIPSENYGDIIFNFEGESEPIRDGCSIRLFNGFSNFTEIQLQIADVFADRILSSCIMGNYYDMPHSPDLNLTLTREYDGTKTLETKGGSTLTNSYWKKQPNWGNGFPAWHIDTNVPTTAPLSVSGRRVWNLSFSYLQDSDAFPEISNLTNFEHLQPSGTTDAGIAYDEGNYYYGTDGINDNTPNDYNLSSNARGYALNNYASNSNFFSEVIHKTIGLPFIFQPDNTNNNPDQFAICMFDQNSFQFKQVANNVYNISMTIREVW